MANKYIYNIHTYIYSYIHYYIQCYQLIKRCDKKYKIKNEKRRVHLEPQDSCLDMLLQEDTNIPKDFTTFSSALVIILKNFSSLGIGALKLLPILRYILERND